MRMEWGWAPLAGALAGTALGALGFAALDQRLACRRYTLQSEKIHRPLRLAFLSDLHGTRYGKGQRKLLEGVRKFAPHLVLLGGDLLDENHPQFPAFTLLGALAREFPCFEVWGNHECRLENRDELARYLDRLGITLLEGEKRRLSLEGQLLDLYGVGSPARFGEVRKGFSYLQPNLAGWEEEFSRCKARWEPQVFSLLLSHHPELVPYYQSSPFDLVLCGHAHGGQMRLPGMINGLYAPTQGFFPTHAGGAYPLGEGRTMVVGRGLQRSLFPPRVFNPPELVLITLTPAR